MEVKREGGGGCAGGGSDRVSILVLMEVKREVKRSAIVTPPTLFQSLF